MKPKYTSTIQIIVKEWWDSANGNTYGSHLFIESMKALTGSRMARHTYCQQNNILLIETLHEECLKRDVKEWGAQP